MGSMMKTGSHSELVRNSGGEHFILTIINKAVIFNFSTWIEIGSDTQVEKKIGSSGPQIQNN